VNLYFQVPICTLFNAPLICFNGHMVSLVFRVPGVPEQFQRACCHLFNWFHWLLSLNVGNYSLPLPPCSGLLLEFGVSHAKFNNILEASDSEPEIFWLFFWLQMFSLWQLVAKERNKKVRISVSLTERLSVLYWARFTNMRELLWSYLSTDTSKFAPFFINHTWSSLCFSRKHSSKLTTSFINIPLLSSKEQCSCFWWVFGTCHHGGQLT
jgi:hypothetical protein